MRWPAPPPHHQHLTAHAQMLIPLGLLMAFVPQRRLLRGPSAVVTPPPWRLGAPLASPPALPPQPPPAWPP
eukprot:2228921-Pyramimonas_sp.AAC.1